MILPILSCALAVFFLAAHLTTLLIAWWRCRPQAVSRSVPIQQPPITLVRPLCGVETFSAETLEATFHVDYPTHELLFCVATADDPILPMVEAAIARHPQVSAKLLVGNDPISINPKLNNMVKGWREATHEWIVFIDSNVLVPPDVLQRCLARWRGDTGAVSAPPVGIMPDGFGGYFECAFLNTYEARWQYAVDSVGKGFAQGKTLFYRKADLDRSGLRDLAAEPAEDAATTKMVRKMGLRVRLAPPSPMPIGRRDFKEVWSRQLRWARLRRATFLLEFLPEIVSGLAAPITLAGIAAASLDAPILATLCLYAALWEGSEWALARACGWPAGWRLLPALLVRDLVMPALWIGAFTGRSVTWKGTAMQMDKPARRNVEPRTS